VTRWGRFQDVDEGAHLEYECKKRGVTVQYCAKPFMNDGSMSSNVMKTLKRVMAGEYSSELSRRSSKGSVASSRPASAREAPPDMGSGGCW